VSKLSSEASHLLKMKRKTEMARNTNTSGVTTTSSITSVTAGDLNSNETQTLSHDDEAIAKLTANIQETESNLTNATDSLSYAVALRKYEENKEFAVRYCNEYAEKEALINQLRERIRVLHILQTSMLSLLKQS